jgi:Domain of unknown function (DUF4863)
MEPSINLTQFTRLLEKPVQAAEGRALNKELEAYLNHEFPAAGPEVALIFAGCKAAIAAGWMCQRNAGGIRYGRVIKPSPQLAGFSVDVVDMQSIAGPHHAHPNGEIDLIMPIDPQAKFDGQGAGWMVYEPGSSHAPTVTGGQALILYLLPHGAIDFQIPHA